MRPFPLLRARPSRRVVAGFVSAVLALPLLAAPAAALDANEWSSAYGTRARLLGGVVIGSPGDVSAVYYNPGAYAFTSRSEFLLAGSAYQYLRVAVDKGSGSSKDLISSSISPAPTLLAGDLPLLDRDRLAYSFLARQEADLRMEFQSTTGVESATPLPNPSFAALEFGAHQSMSEYWSGLTWAHRLSSSLGVGASSFLAVRSQRTTYSVLAEGRNAGGEAAVLDMSRDFDYIHYRLLARLGLSGRRDSLTYGVTLTTPGLGLMGGGNYRENTTLVDETGAVGGVMGASYQPKLDADYRSPFQAGAGASFGWGASRVHASAEWSAEVPSYAVLEGVPYTIATPSGDSTVTAIVLDQRREVFNWGLGAEHRFGGRFVGFLSYHTDRSTRAPDMAPGASVTRWNLNHVAAGTTFSVKRSDFALGASVAFGNQPFQFGMRRPDGVSAYPNLTVRETIVTVLAGWKITF